MHVEHGGDAVRTAIMIYSYYCSDKKCRNIDIIVAGRPVDIRGPMSTCVKGIPATEIGVRVQLPYACWDAARV